MPWELRRGREYYYRARRVQGRVVKQYLGSGDKAQAAAAEDAVRREAKQQTLHRRRQTDAALAAWNRQLDPYWALADRLLGLALAVHGYYRRRGEWRRCRV